VVLVKEARKAMNSSTAITTTTMEVIKGKVNGISRIKTTVIAITI